MRRAGNTASLIEVLREMGVDGLGTKVFPTPDATQARLEAAGFVDVRCWLQAEPTPIAFADFETYLRVICLGGILEDMHEADRGSFVRDVAARMPGFRIDYIRLNISGRRANTSIGRIVR